ncbi:MAG: hypothetical protein H6Q15_2345 [Bacteroidetes bacterium]|nr:hypothetical protein [Bacteroidota bacterium]
MKNRIKTNKNQKDVVNVKNSFYLSVQINMDMRNWIKK